MTDRTSDTNVFVDELYYKSMLDVLPERVIRFRLPDLTILYCNASWASGHNLTPADVVGRTMDDLLSTAGRADLELQLVRLGPDTPLVRDVTRAPGPQQSGHWVEWVDQYLPSIDGAEVLAVGRDVTGRHIAELFLADSEARFRDLADKSADVVWRFFEDPIRTSTTSVPRSRTSWAIPLRTSSTTSLGSSMCSITKDRRTSRPGPGRWDDAGRFDLRYRCADGSTVIFETQTTEFAGGTQGVSRDVTELRTLQESLAALALRDPLTGLANRHLLNELLEAALSRTERSGLPLAVVFLDLDSLKVVNDTYGHDVATSSCARPLDGWCCWRATPMSSLDSAATSS